jgi:two-component system sensor kinase FixL
MGLNLTARIASASLTKVLAGTAITIAVIALADRFLFRDAPRGDSLLSPYLLVPLHVIVLAGAALAFVLARLREQSARAGRAERAEREARAVLETSPAAILTVQPDGAIDMANEAATRLLAIPVGQPPGRIGDYFPTLAELQRSRPVMNMVRTMIECRGQRAGGDSFFAQMWISTLPGDDGARLAVVVADVSEQMRDREELGLRQLLQNSTIIAGAVSHEIRNLAMAATTLYTRIGQRTQMAGNEDYAALGSLIEALRKLSAPAVPLAFSDTPAGLDLNALLGELKIIAGSGEDDVEMEWTALEVLPRVRAEHGALLRVLLNLLRNSQRALSGQEGARIRISAYTLGDSVIVSFSDNGPGVARPEILFQPFQPGAHASGLGLYVSRAIVRTFGGELHYERRPDGSRFVIQLPVAGDLHVRKAV